MMNCYFLIHEFSEIDFAVFPVGQQYGLTHKYK